MRQVISWSLLWPSVYLWEDKLINECLRTEGDKPWREKLCVSPAWGSTAPLVYPSDTRRAPAEKQTAAVQPNEYGSIWVRNSVTRKGEILFNFGKHVFKEILFSFYKGLSEGRLRRRGVESKAQVKSRWSPESQQAELGPRSEAAGRQGTYLRNGASASNPRRPLSLQIPKSSHRRGCIALEKGKKTWL